jgi:hypothetical protein
MRFQQSWTQSATLTPPRTGYAIVGVTDPFGVRVLAQPTQVATARTQLGRRLVGDIHAHTGIDATRSFTPSSDVLDHRGNFTHAYDALRYLKEVGGADFGAISEHSTWTPGWTPPAESHWKVVDGILVGENDAEKKGSMLYTEKAYGDVILEGEVRFEGEIDSGFMLRKPELQLQIGVSRSLKRDMTCSFYVGNYPDEAQAKRAGDLLKPGDWNRIRIRAQGDTFTVWLNGEPVSQYTSAKYADPAPIGLQIHGGLTMKVEFRDLRALPLE